jgi:hypothetical protein
MPRFCGVTVVATSGAALLVSIDGHVVWIPYSQIQNGSDVEEGSSVGDVGDIIIPRWLASREGLDYDEDEN